MANQTNVMDKRTHGLTPKTTLVELACARFLVESFGQTDRQADG